MRVRYLTYPIINHVATRQNWVSTADQHAEAQIDALTAAGCQKLFTDHASGTLAHRPGLDDALNYLRAGDTLIITKLDRSVKSLKAITDELAHSGVALRVLSQGLDPAPTS